MKKLEFKMFTDRGLLFAITVILLHQRIMNQSDLSFITENRIKQKVPLRGIFCIMRLCFD